MSTMDPYVHVNRFTDLKFLCITRLELCSVERNYLLAWAEMRGLIQSLTLPTSVLFILIHDKLSFEIYVNLCNYQT